MRAYRWSLVASASFRSRLTRRPRGSGGTCKNTKQQSKLFQQFVSFVQTYDTGEGGPVVLVSEGCLGFDPGGPMLSTDLFLC